MAASGGADSLTFPLFHSMAAAEVDYLRPRLQARAFSRGDVILRRGQMAGGLYLIASGLVGVNLSEEPEGEDIASLGSGECVGEMSLMNGEPCSATIHALTDTDVLVISRRDFPDVVEHCPTLWRNLSAILSRRLVQTNRRLTQSARARTTALHLLVDPARASALALTLGALLARQSGRRVVLVDLDGRGLAGTAPGLPPAEVTPGLSVVSPAPAGPAASEAAEQHLLAERLRADFDQIVVMSDPDGPDLSPWAAGSTLIVSSRERVPDAIGLTRSSAPSPAHRIDLAVLTDLAVTSDNGVGGLWEPAVTALNARIAGELRDAAPAARLRFLPRDPGILDRVASEGAAAVRPDSDEPFQQALARLARRLGGMEVGVALGAGMAKGFSHIGVLRALEREGVPVDYLAGSSIGSIVGSVYAGGMPLEQLTGLMTGADKRFVKLTLPFKSISSSRGLRKILTTCHERAPTAQFPELFLPFAATTTDVTSGEEVVIRDGIVWQAVLASISMPGIFPPVEYRGRVLVDGGLVNPVPGKTVRDMGADIVIGVDLAARSGRPPTAGRARVPNIIEVLWRTMEIMLGEITSRSAASADVTIQPATGHSRIRDFSHRGPEFIGAGESAVAEALPSIRRLLAAEGTAVAV